MSAIFRINQDGVTGSWGVARRDMTLFSVGGTITLEAQSVGEGTYLWELVSEPEGSTGIVVSPTSYLASVDLSVRGGFIVRLTINAGLSTEDVSELYLGIPLPTSGLCLPAFNETIQDNSQGSGYYGYERKYTALIKWFDSNSIDSIFVAGTGDFSTVRKDCGNVVDGDYAFAVGSGNTVDGDYSSVLGKNNTLTSSCTYSFVTGQNHDLTATWGALVFGNNNETEFNGNQIANSLVGGMGNIVASGNSLDSSVVVGEDIYFTGGYTMCIVGRRITSVDPGSWSWGSAIFGEFHNISSDCSYNVIGGADHDLLGYTRYNIIGGLGIDMADTVSALGYNLIGGQQLDVTGTSYVHNNVICGDRNDIIVDSSSLENSLLIGKLNTIRTEGKNSIVAGEENDVTNPYNALFIGSGITATSSTRESIVCGTDHSIDSYIGNSFFGGYGNALHEGKSLYSGIAVGASNTVSGDNMIIGGQSHDTQAHGSIVSGYGHTIRGTRSQRGLWVGQHMYSQDQYACVQTGDTLYLNNVSYSIATGYYSHYNSVSHSYLGGRNNEIGGDAGASNNSLTATFSVVGSTVTFTDPAALFSPEMDGGDLVVTEAESYSNTGTHSSITYISPTQVSYDDTSATDQSAGAMVRWYFLRHDAYNGGFLSSILSAKETTVGDKEVKQSIISGELNMLYPFGTITDFAPATWGTNSGTGISFEATGVSGWTTLSDSSGPFSSDIENAYITITGSTSPGNDGSFKLKYFDGGSVGYTNNSAVTEPGVAGTTWSITYLSATAFVSSGFNIGPDNAQTTITIEGATNSANNGTFGVIAGTIEDTGSGATFKIINLSGVSESASSATWRIGSLSITNTLVSGDGLMLSDCFSAVITGHNNSVKEFDAGIIAGQDNTAYAGGSSAGLMLGRDNKATYGGGSLGIIFGQANNVYSASYSMVGGLYNTVNSPGNSIIVTGTKNYVAYGGAGQGIVLGSNNTVTSGGTTNGITCGTNQRITSGAGSNAIVCGLGHFVTSGALSNSILFGYQNDFSSGGSSNSIIGGDGNILGSSVTSSVVVSNDSSIDGACVLAVGTDFTLGSGSSFDVLLGVGHIATSGSTYNTVLGYYNNATSGCTKSLVVGQYSTATAGTTSTIVSGTNAYGYSHRSGLITSSGHPANNIPETATVGEAQATVAMNFVGRTTDATVTDLGETSGGGGHPVQADHAYTVQALITAKCTSGTSSGGMKSWIQEFAVNHTGGTATIVDSSEREMSTLIGNEASWGAEIIIDTNGFFLQVTGHADDSINWHASFTSSEVGITTS